MSWDDFYRRRDALEAVLEHARRNPDEELPFAEARGVFGTTEDLLLALHYKWIMALTGRVGVALAEAQRDPEVRRVDSIATLAPGQTEAQAQAFASSALGASSAGPLIEGEQRLLALAAGLAEPHDTTAEITRIGATYLALVRAAPEHSAPRRGPVGLLRRLVASA